MRKQKQIKEETFWLSGDSQLNPLTPKIWLLTLSLVLDQDSSFYLISLNIHITCLLNDVWIL